MESLAIFVALLLALITITAPLAFVLTTRKVQEFTAARGWLNLLRQIVGGLIATIGIFFAVITVLGVSGLGIRTLLHRNHCAQHLFDYPRSKICIRAPAQ
jgi:hypothetical protein